MCGESLIFAAFKLYSGTSRNFAAFFVSIHKR